MNELVFQSEKGNPVTTLSNVELKEFVRSEYPSIGDRLFMCHSGFGSYLSDGVVVIPLIDILDKLIKHSYKWIMPEVIDMVNELLPLNCGYLQHVITTSLFHWCTNSKKDRVKSINQKTYIIRDKSSGLCKIGKSADLSTRIASLSNGNPNLSILLAVNRNVESELHRKYAHKNIRGEWFNLTDDDLIDINEIYITK